VKADRFRSRKRSGHDEQETLPEEQYLLSQ